MGSIRVVGDAYHLYAKMSCYIHCKQVYAGPFLRINNTIFCLYLAYNLHGFSWDQGLFKTSVAVVVMTNNEEIQSMAIYKSPWLLL